MALQDELRVVLAAAPRAQSDLLLQILAANGYTTCQSMKDLQMHKLVGFDRQCSAQVRLLQSMLRYIHFGNAGFQCRVPPSHCHRGGLSKWTGVGAASSAASDGCGQGPTAPPRAVAACASQSAARGHMLDSRKRSQEAAATQSADTALIRLDALEDKAEVVRFTAGGPMKSVKAAAAFF